MTLSLMQISAPVVSVNDDDLSCIAFVINYIKYRDTRWNRDTCEGIVLVVHNSGIGQHYFSPIARLLTR
jgi:hypothetical protein